MKVAVKESCMVRPAKETPRQRLWLSNLDQLVVKSNARMMTMLQPYRPDGRRSRNFFDGRVLKESLSQALVTFFPAAGRLARDESGEFEIDCGGQGVLFVEAETDATISDMGDFQPGSELLQLVPQVDFSKGISSFPLLLVQCYNLFTKWASLARDRLPVTANLLPFLDRTILRSRSPPAQTCHFVLNFGWGDPIFTRAPNSEGSRFILSNPNDGDDGVSLSINLEVVTMERFKGMFNTTWPQLHSHL
ncbi:unnamed protein product [Linum tenue]|uniref:Uncharacterized protein n=1 Tax=Linum tenue TaxID=586396 RepID=A0AAV0JLU6_9ROSI|nr:unnamed protein product [Linum tenue]